MSVYTFSIHVIKKQTFLIKPTMIVDDDDLLIVLSYNSFKFYNNLERKLRIYR